MPVFIQSFTSTQSADGKTVTLADTSNYGINSNGYVRSNFTRQFVLTDYVGTVLATITLNNIDDSATYTLTEDLHINITFNLTGIASYTLLQSYPFMRITANKLQNALKNGCCLGAAKLNALNEATNFIIAAQFAAPTTDHAAFQTNINSANLFLDTIV